MGELCARKSFLADSVEQRVGQSGQQHTKLVGQPFAATGPVREKVQLLFFNPVFHFASGAVTLVELLRSITKTGDDKTGITPFFQMFGLDDDTTLSVTSLSGIGCFVKNLLFGTGLEKAFVNFVQQRLCFFQQSGILGKAEDIPNS